MARCARSDSGPRDEIADGLVEIFLKPYLLYWLEDHGVQTIPEVRVPAERRGVFLEAVLDDYLARYPLDADGNAHVRMQRLEVEADKPA